MDLNNRRTGKHATKPRALGLLGHSVSIAIVISGDRTVNIQNISLRSAVDRRNVVNYYGGIYVIPTYRFFCSY